MNKKIISGIITLALLVLCLISTQIKNTVVSTDDSDYEIAGNVGQISEGTVVEYDFKASGERVQGYQFLFATYGEKIDKGTVYVEVYDKDTGEMLGDGKVSASTIQDNEMTLVKTGEMALGKRNIRMTIFCEGFEENKMVTLWLGETDENADGETFVNGMKMKNNLLVFAQKLTEEAPYTWDVILLTAISFAVFCCMPGNVLKVWHRRKDEQDEKITQA